ncbi:MAG TPA: T9SS type A sorting domain-containing protein [Chitinophagales bacterium]|nr:T9SS type A sorting domain-containing protein [Chitinophagales bacterium]HRK28444.1 T9SS type A sorting domain-containing protein [Chitinophagales bacterium]
MQKPFLLIALLWLLQTGITNIAAQKHIHPNAQKNQQIWDVEERKATVHFVNLPLPLGFTSEVVAKQLTASLPNLAKIHTELALTDISTSPLGTHYGFTQTYKGLPIYSTQVKAMVNAANELLLFTENTYDTEVKALQNLFKNTPTPLPAKAVSRFCAANNLQIEGSPTEMLFFYDPQTPIRVWHFKAWNKQAGLGFAEYLLAASGNLVYERSLQNYYGKTSGSKTTTTETVPGKVFMPNPTTSAQVNYGQGGKYRDNKDADATELTAELKDVTLDVTLEDGIYKLENNFVRIAEFDNPVIPPYTSTLPQFNLTRSHDGFEDVNAYYHLNAYQQYLQALGFNLVQTQVQVDTHGKNGDDQSMHIFTGTEHRLVFGSGHSLNKHHVDDAEDADVIIHEYGHAISASACLNCNTGTERTAIDEAIGDYLATSYKRALYTFNWQKMFSWDGHNEFWNGRNVASTKRYPEDNINDIYYRSEIFSSVLMQIWEVMGRENADKLVISALYQFTAGIDMRAAASILLFAEQQLFSGDYAQSIQNLLLQRGLLEYQVNAGPDFSVCLGESVTLGVPNAPDAPPGTKLYWSPGLTLSDSTAANPIAYPDKPTTYTLHVLNLSTNVAFTDNAFVNVAYCFNNTPGNNIRLLNTDRFFKRRGNIIVEVPPLTQQVNLTIYDVYGRIVKQYTNPGDDRLEIEGDDLPPGIYLLRIEADSKKATFKIGRVR